MGGRVATVKRITSNAWSTSGIVVDDLATATAFFVGLGLRLQVEGGWVVRLGIGEPAA